MNIPALVAGGAAVLDVPDGADVLIDADGGTGTLDLAPNPQSIAETKQRVAAAAARQARERAAASADCFTADGVRVEVFANLGKGAEEAAEAVRLGAEGCGVLRTEFLFMDRETPPSGDEQFAAYQGIADALAGRSFIIRTFDIGADKPVPYLQFPPEDNPQLGLRGVRTAEVWPELLKTQLQAASRVKGAVKIMLPMITAPHELRTIRAILNGLGGSALSLGAMVETPSAAMLADLIAAEADFLSIGTNDLTQYVLAIDRGHRALSGQLDALHPAVLRLIARTAEAARAAHKTAAVCGGLAADPSAAPLLIGLGISELSVPPPVIPRLKAAIRKLDSEDCRTKARAALDLETPADVRAFVKANFGGESQS
jgi:phosphocarrier protein FPr/phosphocarrier protein